MAAAFVLGANTALRPIVHAINRQPIESTEEEQHATLPRFDRLSRGAGIRHPVPPRSGVRRRAGRPFQRSEQHVHRKFRPRRGDSHNDLSQATGAGAREIVARLSETNGVSRASWREQTHSS